MTTLELLEKPVDKPGANLLLMEGALPGGWTPTSVTLPDDLSEQETDGLLMRLLTVGRGHQWWIGDTLNYRNRRFASQKYTFAMLETGFSKGYLANMASVAKRFETSRRREVLPWAYHADVRGLTDEEQNRWLDQCQAENWSRKELRKQLKAAITGYDPDAQPLEFASDEEDAGTESLAIGEAEAGEESADLQAFMRDIPEPLRVDEATMNGLLKTLSGTLIPQGTIAAPLQMGENWWVLLTVHRAGTPDARDDFGLAQRVVPIDEFQGEAFPLTTWQQRVVQGAQEKDDYAGLVVRPNLGRGAWVLVNERMQVSYKSEHVEQITPAEPASPQAVSPFGDLNAPVEGGNIVTRILANDQLDVKPWVKDEWHVHDVRDSKLVGYFHTCNAGEGYYLRVEAAVNGGRIRLENAKTFARARYILADHLLEQQRYTRPQTPTAYAASNPEAETPQETKAEVTAHVPLLSGDAVQSFDVAAERWHEFNMAASNRLLTNGQIAPPIRIGDQFYCISNALFVSPLLGTVFTADAVRVWTLDAYIDERRRRMEADEPDLPLIINWYNWQREVSEGKRTPDNIAGLKVAMSPSPKPDEPNTSAWWILTDYRVGIRGNVELNQSETPTDEGSSEDGDAGFEQMVDALPDAMAAMGREEAEEPNVMTLEDVYGSMLAATVQRMDFALADVFQDYPGLLNHVVPDAPEEPPVILTEEAFIEWWQPVISGMARMIASPEGLVMPSEAGLRVDGNDLVLLATLAARRRPGQTEPISTAEYLHDMIAQKAEQAGVTLETAE